MNQESVLSLVSRRLGDFLGNRAIPLSAEDMQAVPLAFYGISQGAILGAGYTEFSSLVRRRRKPWRRRRRCWYFCVLFNARKAMEAAKAEATTPAGVGIGFLEPRS